MEQSLENEKKNQLTKHTRYWLSLLQNESEINYISK